jgi:hypothetical protein
MAYNPNIPQATDQLNVSQSDILNNFQALAPFGNGYALLPNITPTPSPDSSHVALYAQAVSGVLELFFERAGATTGVPFTQGVPAGTIGWSRFASNMMVVWQSLTASTFPYTFTYSSISTFPGFDSAGGNPTVLVSPFGAGTYALTVTSSTPTAVTIGASTFAGGSPGTQGFCWIAISRGTLV